jgi:hypothetical protein
MATVQTTTLPGCQSAASAGTTVGANAAPATIKHNSKRINNLAQAKCNVNSARVVQMAQREQIT